MRRSLQCDISSAVSNTVNFTLVLLELGGGGGGEVHACVHTSGWGEDCGGGEDCRGGGGGGPETLLKLCV